MPAGNDSVRRGRDGRLVVPLDEQRAMDFGVIGSMVHVSGGTSALLYSVKSGTNVYLKNLVVTPFGSNIATWIRLLDGTTAVTIGAIVSGALTTVVPFQTGRFLSSIFVDTGPTGITYPMTNLGSGPFAVYAEVIVDPRTFSE